MQDTDQMLPGQTYTFNVYVPGNLNSASIKYYLSVFGKDQVLSALDTLPYVSANSAIVSSQGNLFEYVDNVNFTFQYLPQSSAELDTVGSVKSDIVNALNTASGVTAWEAGPVYTGNVPLPSGNGLTDFLDKFANAIENNLGYVAVGIGILAVALFVFEIRGMTKA